MTKIEFLCYTGIVAKNTQENVDAGNTQYRNEKKADRS